MVIDSCLDNRKRHPAALEYFSKLKVDVALAVKVLLVTHWHNDHALGASEILRAAESSILWCSGALQNSEFSELVAASAREKVDELELPEFRELLKILKARNLGARPGSVGPKYAIEGRPIYTRDASSGGIAANVHALSPSDGALSLAHLEFARFLPRFKKDRLTPVALSPNNVSVVVWIEVGNARALLGSDLEESGSNTLGWQAIVGSRDRPIARAQLFKVPHHGSETGHNDQVWTQMLEEERVAMLTTFLKGHKKLPSDEDVQRLKSRTPHVYSTAAPGGWKPRRRAAAVERMLGRKLRAMTGSMGHVRVRWSANDDGAFPLIDLFSGALRL
jgi:hypothetical protein